MSTILNTRWFIKIMVAILNSCPNTRTDRQTDRHKHACKHTHTHTHNHIPSNMNLMVRFIRKHKFYQQPTQLNTCRSWGLTTCTAMRLGWEDQGYLIQVHDLIQRNLSVFLREEFFVWIWQRWHVDHFCCHQSQTDMLSSDSHTLINCGKLQYSLRLIVKSHLLR